jgi:type IV pilus assembly protein PilV
MTARMFSQLDTDAHAHHASGRQEMKTGDFRRFAAHRMSRERGFTMLETLIAIVVVSVGLIAMAALQARSLAEVSISRLRSVSTLHAASLADMMRSNRAGLDAGVYRTNPSSDDVLSACFTTGCTASQVAAAHIAIWRAAIAADLPGGQGIVCVDSTPNDGTPSVPACDGVAGAPYVMKIWWNEDKNTGSFFRSVTAVNP